MRPIVGIACCAKDQEEQIHHQVPARYAEALIGGAGVLPVIIPPVGDVVAVLSRLDGLLLSGSPSNVEPGNYGVAESETPDCHDPLRDGTFLPLIRAAIDAGVPVLGICRGHQELNVALGGTLHQQVHNVPNRLDHRGGEGDIAHRYRPKHTVALSSRLTAMAGVSEMWVNSIHGQAIDRPAPDAAIEAVAPDGTIEAIRITSAKAFAMGFQWHPEWAYAHNPFSMALFQAFGDACRERAERLGHIAAPIIPAEAVFA